MNSENDLKHFNALIEAYPTATAIYSNRNITIAAANQEMLDLWGKNNSVIGKEMADAIPELIDQPFISLLQQVYDTGITYQGEQEAANLIVDGQLKTSYFNFTYKALKDEHGKTMAIIHNAIDVTELVITKKRISETEERLSFALESAEIGTWEMNLCNETILWDQRCQEIFGFDGSNEIDYNTVLNCVHPLDKETVALTVAAAIDPERMEAFDLRYRTLNQLNQTLRWLHCKGKAYFNDQGNLYRFAGIAMDITKEVTSSLSEQQLLSLIKHNADHMSIADLEGRLIYMNQSGRKMLGVPEDTDISTMTAADFYHPDELKRVQQTLIPQISEENGWQGVIHLRNYHSKQEIPCDVNYILIKDPFSGAIIGRGATARDLRPEIKAKAELKRLATIVDISEDFCNYCDLDGNTIYINEAGGNLIGINPASINGANLYQYHSAISADEIRNMIIPELYTHGKWSGRLELVHQVTGEIIPIHKQLFIIRQELSNEPVAIAGIARDLRKELNAKKAVDKKTEELKQAIKEMEFLANTVPAVVWTSHPDGMLDYINDRWHERSDVSIAESLGHNWIKMLHPDDVKGVTQRWKLSVDTGNPYQTEFRMLDKHGNYRWWLVRALALKDANDKIIKWYGTNTDITDQKELERQKDNFLAVASHELKTPVTSIKAYAQVLEMMLNRAGDTKNAVLMSKMDGQINRLTSLIGDLLDVTKINSGRLEFDNLPFDFNQMMLEIIEDMQLTSGRHQIKHQLSFKRMVTGDKERIAQVVINLITNAIKYSPNADRIIIYTEDHDTEVQLCVQDFGIGLTREKMDRVFEQFYRVSGTKEHTFPGLGLGLYISSEIIKQLGGKIWVNSVIEKGSTFCFSIPLNNSN
ncbi:PAS domain-containing protein [Pedobacter sp. N36a]|uniref:PAS domain-containing sensor histidine kinase n=1 Tax=Pedobacter sp. N36a TaxID=2767996 RepID=UPI0016573CFD|nr:PAS domain-containing protein [Pedobacter sp. N36a]MBC8985043.1 PAS domain-containing protein [Pedobacter sp. N36a]